MCRGRSQRAKEVSQRATTQEPIAANSWSGATAYQAAARAAPADSAALLHTHHQPGAVANSTDAPRARALNQLTPCHTSYPEPPYKMTHTRRATGMLHRSGTPQAHTVCRRSGGPQPAGRSRVAPLRGGRPTGRRAPGDIPPVGAHHAPRRLYCSRPRKCTSARKRVCARQARTMSKAAEGAPRRQAAGCPRR